MVTWLFLIRDPSVFMSRGAGQIWGGSLKFLVARRGGQVKYFYVEGGSYDFKKQTLT